MTGTQKAVLVAGIAFVVFGIAGFVTSGSSMEADPSMAPELFGTFPVNVLHNVVHLALGLWGLIAARTWHAARTYARATGVLYLLLAGLGLIAPDGFGLVPIGGSDVALHAFLGVSLLAIGLAAKEGRLRTA